VTHDQLLSRVLPLLGLPPTCDDDDPRAITYSKAANLATAACGMLALGHVARAVETLQLIAALDDRPGCAARWRALAEEVAGPPC
jgi:hypothetical protein